MKYKNVSGDEFEDGTKTAIFSTLVICCILLIIAVTSLGFNILFNQQYNKVKEENEILYEFVENFDTYEDPIEMRDQLYDEIQFLYE